MLAALPLAGRADTCPTSADVATGVIVDHADGMTSVITRDASGAVREEETSAGSPPYIYIAANGLLETGFIDGETGAEDGFAYSFSTDDILPLRPWSSDRGEQVTTDSSGEEITRIPFEWRTRGLTTWTLGGCSYAAIPVETYYHEPGDPSMVEFVYLTELRIPIAVGYAYLGGGIGSAEPYRPVAIRPAPQE